VVRACCCPKQPLVEGGLSVFTGSKGSLTAAAAGGRPPKAGGVFRHQEAGSRHQERVSQNLGRESQSQQRSQCQEGGRHQGEVGSRQLAGGRHHWEGHRDHREEG
jgi:hypothetical protein